MGVNSGGEKNEGVGDIGNRFLIVKQKHRKNIFLRKKFSSTPQNPISKDDVDPQIRSPKYCIRTPDIIIFRDWILEAKISKIFLEKYFFCDFVL